jgi:hypothetical protein
MFTDELRRNVWDRIRQQGLRAFAGQLSPTILREAARHAGVKLGRGPLHVANLVWLGLAAALHTAKNFADVLTLALKLLQDTPGWESSPLGVACRGSRRRGRPRDRRRGGRRSQHDPRRRNPGQLSEEAFVQARRRMPMIFWEALFVLLHERFAAEHANLLAWRGFRLLALDGTEINLPNRQRLRDYFGTAANGKGARTVQARMVMLQFPRVRLPWKYTLAPRGQGERTLAAELLTGLRPHDLVLMDRGFWSYGLFCQIQQQRAFFALRLMKGLHFQTRRRYGPDDRLVRWTPTDRQWRVAGLPASITLRVMNYQIPGFRRCALVTSLLDRSIRKEQWVGLAVHSEAGRTLAPGLYHRRWEIETTFMELKVRQGMEGHLRSHTPEGIRYEVAGHVLLYLLVRWLMVEAAAQTGQDPLRLSFLNTLRELTDMSPSLLTAALPRVARVLLPRLLARVAEHLVPLRPGRHYPRPGDTKVRNKGKGKRCLPSKLIRNVA